MKLIVSLVAVAWLMSGCAALTGVPSDDSVTGANLDARTGLCTDATPPPCNPPRD
jgi:predicted small secreted protein